MCGTAVPVPVDRPAAPKIERSLTLHLRGDRGAADLHRICGWIAQELADRCGPYTRIATWNSRGFVDAVRAVGRGEVQVALTRPAAFTISAIEGSGVYTDEFFPELRALGVVPQRDRLVMAVHKDLGVSSFAELRERKPALRLATSLHDGVNHVGLAAHEILVRSGVDIQGWGGELLVDERPHECLARLQEGRANAIVHEAVMLPVWQEVGPHLNFLEIEDEVLDGLFQDFGWPAAVIDDGHFPGSTTFRTLDFSDLLVLTRADLPSDVAYAIAWVLGETRDVIERQYRHPAPERSAITCPLDPASMGEAPIPLHPGAGRYYNALHAS